MSMSSEDITRYVSDVVRKYENMDPSGRVVHYAYEATKVEDKFLMMALTELAWDTYAGWKAAKYYPVIFDQLKKYTGEAQAKFGFFPSGSEVRDETA
jgi:hypothetical protein